MPRFDFLWVPEEGGNIEHIREHGVSPDAVEEVVRDPDRVETSRLESGQHPNPTIATLLRYARALGKTIDVIVSEPVS